MTVAALLGGLLAPSPASAPAAGAGLRTGAGAAPAAADSSVARKARPQPRVTLSSGRRLVVNIDPDLSGSKSWRFRLERRSGGRWRTVGKYRTKGRAEVRSLKVKEGTYRVRVYRRAGYRAMTTGPYRYTRSATAWWAPARGTDWQWQLSGTVDTTVPAPVFDIDGEGNSAATVATLHQRGARVICYFSAGSFEEGRPDAGSFPASVLGSALDGWPDERWLDIRRLDVLLPLMEARIAACRDKGFDAVEPDNVDGYANDTGFALTAADQIAYNRAIAALAHRYGLGVALKNDSDQAAALQPYFDFAVVEECARYGECGAYAPFASAGKAVLHVEYTGTLASFCPATRDIGFSSMLKNLELDAWRSVCP